MEKDNNKDRYISDKSGQKIKVPSKVDSGLKKLYSHEDPYKRMFYLDLLAVCVNYKLGHTKMFKLLKHSPIAEIIKETELRAIIDFIDSCPSGFVFDSLLPAHHEFKPITT